MFNINFLFAAARANPKAPMNQAGRLMGRHCKARLKRGQFKRLARGKRPFHPGLITTAVDSGPTPEEEDALRAEATANLIRAKTNPST
ncbi:MAG TPA: hypothetical protein VGE19_07345 [Pseudoxanthomonas sp.]